MAQNGLRGAAGPVPRTLERYFARQIYGAVLFVLIGFLALFGFFDLIHELGDLATATTTCGRSSCSCCSRAGARLRALSIVVLIGTLYVLAHLASNSEYTVMRGSGFSPARAGLTLVKIGLAFVAATFIIGEWWRRIPRRRRRSCGCAR